MVLILLYLYAKEIIHLINISNTLYAKEIINVINKSKSFNNKIIYGFNLTSARMFIYLFFVLLFIQFHKNSVILDKC